MNRHVTRLSEFEVQRKGCVGFINKQVNKTLKILAICVLILLIAAFSGFSWLYYSGRINTYQPITIKNADNEPINFKAYGVTPFGRVFPFIQPDSFNVSCYYAYCRQIEIQFQAGSKTGKHDIVIEIGNVTYNYQETGNNRFVKPAADRGYVSYWGALLSVFYWIITQRLMKFAWFTLSLLIILRFLFFLYIRKKKIGLLKEFIIKAVSYHKVKIIILFKIIIKHLIQFYKKFTQHIAQFYKKIVFLLKKFLKLLLIISIELILFVIIIFLLSYFFNKGFLQIFEKSNTFLYTIILICSVGIFIIAALYYIMKKFSFSRSFILNIVLLNISVLFSWILIEFGLRLFKVNQTNPEKTGYNYYISIYKSLAGFSQIVDKNSKPQITVKKTNEYTYRYTTNGIGLTGEPWEGKLNGNSKNKIRILSLGDSFTEGVGAPGDSSWPHLLENILNVNYDNEFEVFNAGVSGFDPFYSYYLFIDWLIPYKPDIVLLATNNSDLHEVSARGGMERFQKDGRISFNKGSNFEWLFATSFLTRLIMINGLKYDFYLRPPQTRDVQFNERINILKNSFALFANAATKYKFKFFTIVHPFQEEVRYNDNSSKDLYQWYIKNISNNSINLYDYYINNELINKDNVSEYYWKYDGHHKGRGYNAFAKGVYFKLKEMGVWDSLKHK